MDDLIKDDKEFRNAYRAITSQVFLDDVEPLEIDTRDDRLAI